MYPSPGCNNMSTCPHHCLSAGCRLCMLAMRASHSATVSGGGRDTSVFCFSVFIFLCFLLSFSPFDSFTPSPVVCSSTWSKTSRSDIRLLMVTSIFSLYSASAARRCCPAISKGVAPSLRHTVGTPLG
ncbi:hypothetical protein K439DRAFT_378431 [Ramaria rubella]|nr:hypothetical protein K439DRAFT_378431 [Ramaria rubella]